MKSFLGAIQFLSKYIENLSAQTDVLRKLLKKRNKRKWTEEHTNAFNNLKKLITQLPYIAHYNPKSENILTTDASTKRLGPTLWQKQKDGNLKPIRFVSGYGKEICDKRTGIAGSSAGIGTLSIIYLW